MSSTISKKVELAANIAIIIVATLLATVLAKDYLWLSPSQPSSRETDLPNMSALDIDWSTNRQTLVLALSSTCRFCTESAPFYRRIVDGQRKTRVLVVLPQSIDEGRRYLAELGITTDNLKQAPLSSLGIKGTPTLLLVDSRGVVIRSWVGKLSEEQQTEILSEI